MAKLKIIISKALRLKTGILSALLIVISASSSLKAQPVLGAQNTALGGGGTAYLTGFEATFWNPANLSVNDRLGNIHFGLGQAGILYEPVLSTDVAGDQFFNFTDSFYPYKPSAAEITSAERVTILDKNYPRNNVLSQHQTRTDLILGGMSWHRGDAALSLAVRARFGSRIEVGRGWYSDQFISSNGQEIRDFTLNQHINRLFEFSVGYSREFTFIEGLLPRISKLYVGIAPKIVLAGPSFDVVYDARYIRSEDGSSNVYATDFSYRTTGDYSRMTFDYLAFSDPQSAINNNLTRKFNLKNTGLGMGFDFGLTYLLPLGSNLNILEESVVSNSLRFSFSINDLGMIRYSKTPLEFSSPKDTVQINREAPKDFMFIGSGGQYLTYFDDTESIPNPIINPGSENRDAFSVLLPTSINTGILIDFSRVKVMGDLTLGLNNTAFTSTKLTINLGLELRPIEQVPVRMGARLASGIPTHIGFGTGIETRYFDFNIGTQVIFRSRSFTSEFVGGAFAGIQLHL